MTPTIELLRSHRSIRHFTDAPVSDEQRAAIIASAQAASTSSFLQCTSIIRITDPALRERDRKSTRLNSSPRPLSRMPSSA